jgi:hypothetical protein
LKRPTTTVLLVLALGGCGAGELQLPPGPDMTALVTAYQAPTAPIDVAMLDTLRTNVQARLLVLHLDWLPDLVADALTRLGAQLDANGLSDPNASPPTNRPIIDAVVSVDRVCVGWDDPPGPPDATKNGAINLTAVVDDGRLRQDVEALATMCHARIQPSGAAARGSSLAVDGFVDGTLDVHFYGRVPRTVAETDVLVRIQGQIGVSGATTSGEADFRVRYPDLDFTVEQPGGEIIVTISTDGVTLQGSNVTVQCSADLSTCNPA